MDTSKKFKILSIDGGGIRGLIPAKVLAELENELQKENPDKKLHEHFDLICGTSTGAILAIGLSLGISAKELAKFYEDNAKIIFPRFYFRFIPRKSRAFFNAIYSNKRLLKKLREVYADANGGSDPLLNDLKNKVCIPSFNGNDGAINVLKTKHHPEYRRDYKLPAYHVAMSSASAPVYFPPHTFSFKNELGEGTNINMIDGGIFANNPALIGVFEATDKLDIPIGNISILSLGTGQGKQIIKKTWRPKNVFDWLFPSPKLVDIVLDTQAQITEQYLLFLQRALGKIGNTFNHLRIQHDMKGDNIELNSSKKKHIDRMKSIGEEIAKNRLTEILNFLKQ
ncbi:patatin-like phospholipase family protein [Sphingobacterium multivorum]|uniref:Patatin-like phospholipase family protein n=1 Tax=Sphingobacterium multivorum TaxID=28454 RepID=A0ABX7CL74_SPHMU|nr:CBASS cGAMP-activated phospholipase [Sphingobacterium multivorum]QQT52090.1 patatin-like phospholipase family protein [Sphingobacterium multivorum]